MDPLLTIRKTRFFAPETNLEDTDLARHRTILDMKENWTSLNCLPDVPAASEREPKM